MIIDEEKELELFKEFGILVGDLNQDDLTLRRFLRARNHNLDKAEEMLRKSMEWRRLNKVDEALTWVPLPEVINAFPVEFPGVDRKNQVIYYGHVGGWPLREIFGKGYKDLIIQYLYLYFEQLMQKIEQSGEQLFTLIIDFEGFSYWNLGRYDIIQHILRICRDFEANYPERLYEALLIYSPLAMYYGWSLVKPLLSAKTVQKIKFLGAEPRQFLPALLERIPPSSLPKKLCRLMEKEGEQ